MIFVLLLIIAFAAYTFGSFSVKRLSSKLFFQDNLNKLGKGNKLLMNFRRNYGWKGLLKVALTEILLDVIPIILGGALLKGKDLEMVGRVFALFCVVMGKQWPFIHYFRGQTAAFAIIVGSFFLGLPAGIVTVVLSGAVLLVLKYRSLFTPAAAFAVVILSYFYLNNEMVSKLSWCLFAVAVIHTVPALPGVINGDEERLSFNDDISWKFERNF